MRRILGCALFTLSFVAWAVIATLPFLDISVGLAAVITTGLVICGEVAFVASLALLGKDFWRKLYSYFLASKNREK